MITNKLKYTLIAILILFGSAANASSDIEIKHAVIAYEPIGNMNQISLSLVIDNIGDIDFHNVKISPSGNDYALDEDTIITIGNLPVMGQSVIQLTAKTPRSASYFQSGFPVFFHITAKNDNGQQIEIPVYSNKGGI